MIEASQEGEQRGRSEATKALAVLLYSFGKASFRWLGKLFSVSAVSAYKWVRQTQKVVNSPTKETLKINPFATVSLITPNFQ